MPTIAYLEHSDEASGVHKFYEILCDQTQVLVRFGRIGTVGGIDTYSFPSGQDAEQFYHKKIAGKLKKGYVPATPGQSEKRAIAKKHMSLEQFWALLDATHHEATVMSRRKLSF